MESRSLLLTAYSLGVVDGALGAQAAPPPKTLARVRAALAREVDSALRKEAAANDRRDRDLAALTSVSTKEEDGHGQDTE